MAFAREAGPFDTELGTIEAGRDAALPALSCHPLHDIERRTRAAAVFESGARADVGPGRRLP